MTLTRERGRSIVIEGNDATGKSTQVELLAEWLLEDYGIESLTIHEPDGPTDKCRELRARIKDATIPRTPLENLQWLTESREDSNRFGRKFYIDVGKWVLRARNHRSTEAYQGAGEGLSTELIYRMTREHTDELYMHPDFEVILYLEELKRIQRLSGREAPEKPDTFETRGVVYQRAVNDHYMVMGRRDNVPLIEASPPPLEIHQQIKELLWIRGLLPRR